MPIKTARRIRFAGRLIFFMYVAGMVYFLFFAVEYGRRQGGGAIRYNLVPFAEILRFIRHRDMLGQESFYLNVFGNILAFCPFGVILPVLRRDMRSFGSMLLQTASFTTCIEITQLVTRAGVFDVDDILLNTLGGMIGYGFFCLCDQFRRQYYG